MFLNHANNTTENLRACTSVALGTACQLLREYGLTPREFWTKHPELWRPEIPAEPFRRFLISGGAL